MKNNLMKIKLMKKIEKNWDCQKNILLIKKSQCLQHVWIFFQILKKNIWISMKLGKIV